MSVKPRKATELDHTTFVLDLARALGWRSLHIRPARSDKGWRTPVAGDGKGFPDLVLVRSPRLIVAELKSEAGRLRPEQTAWLGAFSEVAAAIREAIGILPAEQKTEAGIEVYLWRMPSQVDDIRAVLAR